MFKKFILTFYEKYYRFDVLPHKMENLEIYRLVIHELKKEAKKTEAELILSDSLGQIDEFSIKLISEIHKSYKDSSSLKHSHFSDRNDNIFKALFEKYNTEQSDELFYMFSKNSLKDLEVDIVKEPFATGGYYVFADYSIENKRFILVVLLRKKDNLNLLRVENVFTVGPSENLNIEKIAMGFRLNHSIYNSEGDERNYIALITTQQDKVSDYFQEWVAVAEIITDEQNTNNLVKLINNIPLPTDNEGNELFEREEFKKICHQYVNERPNKVVNLKAMSAHFYGEGSEDVITDFAENNEFVIDPEFKRNSKAWNKLTTIKVKVRGIELNVDYDKLNANEVDVQPALIIIRSQELVNQINAKMNESA